MKVEDTLKLSPLDRFIWWITERYSIYLKKERGDPKPWSENEILQKFFFTNAYRELDKTTVWYRDNIREVKPFKNNMKLIFATMAFRRFSFIDTGEILLRAGLFENWDSAKARKLLINQKKIATGGFIVSGGTGKTKLDGICDQIHEVWDQREEIIKNVMRPDRRKSIQAMCHYLTGKPGIGKFMAYEIACDFRWTFILKDAVDLNTWCNPGPGCIRGFMRVWGRNFEKPKNVKDDRTKAPPDFYPKMRELLEICWDRLPKHMPKFELREIEHSLCEVDKYDRISLKQGKARRNYPGLPGMKRKSD
jgi:hypothetical protein